MKRATAITAPRAAIVTPRAAIAARRAAIAATCAGALAGGPAWALCPNCLGQSPSLSPVLRLVGFFLLVPAAVFFAVAFAIRHAQRRDRE